MSRPGNCLIIDNFSVEVGRINTAIRLSVEKALEKITDHDVTTQDYWKKSQKDGTYEAILKAGLIAEMHLTIATSKLVDAHSPSTLKGKKTINDFTAEEFRQISRSYVANNTELLERAKQEFIAVTNAVNTIIEAVKNKLSSENKSPKDFSSSELQTMVRDEVKKIGLKENDPLYQYGKYVIKTASEALMRIHIQEKLAALPEAAKEDAAETKAVGSAAADTVVTEETEEYDQMDFAPNPEDKRSVEEKIRDALAALTITTQDNSLFGKAKRVATNVQKAVNTLLDDEPDLPTTQPEKMIALLNRALETPTTGRMDLTASKNSSLKTLLKDIADDPDAKLQWLKLCLEAQGVHLDDYKSQKAPDSASTR